MKIHEFSYTNKATGLCIKPIKFSDLNLLVGASGVGKTLILKALMDLKDIANGKSISGVEWMVKFSISNGKGMFYLWEGSFEYVGTNIPPDFPERIAYENLYLNDERLINRISNKIIYKGKETPKLPSHMSIISLLNEEESIKSAFEGFYGIPKNFNLKTGRFTVSIVPPKYLEMYVTSESVLKYNLPLLYKLYILYKEQHSIFNKIKRNFVEIFDQVQDIKLEISEQSNSSQYVISFMIKEKGVSDWILQDDISSGMFKTLVMISQLYLITYDTVILIDEVENSLGINCIDSVLNLLITFDERDMQFIMTSHHPYIINAIEMKYWKIVYRKGGDIYTKDASEYNLGKSHHEAFKQLIQLADYKGGIKS
ncbi:MAG: ATP-binding protein [Candidatus Magnetoovum sp. WYHC-5]|nr:ATP-binding protein [Candidatus Magnetoovum sp. WYHC-5]